MRGLDRLSAVAGLLAGVLCACACAGNPAPRGWLAAPRVAQRQAYGGWIELRCGASECGRGELIAVDEDRVIVLGPAGTESVRTAAVTRATLAAYRTQTGAAAAWGTLGTISTISHGGFLILTVPFMWLPVSIGAAAEESRAALVRFPGERWPAFRPYARFPQGLPPGLDLAGLRLPPSADAGGGWQQAAPHARQ